MTPQQRILKLNCEYAAILREATKNLEILRAQDPLKALDQKMDNSSRLYDETGKLLLPVDGYRILEASDAASAFWSANLSEYQSALRDLPGTKMLANRRELSLAGFFDTLILDDGLPGQYAASTSQEIRVIGYSLCLLRTLDVLPFLEADLDHPIVALYPSIPPTEFGPRQQDTTAASTTNVYVNRLLNQVSQNDGNFSSGDIDWALLLKARAHSDKPMASADKLFDLERLEQLAGSFIPSNRLEDASFLIHNISGALLSLVLSDRWSHPVGADPLVSPEMQALYTWKLEQDVTRVSEIIGLQAETAIPRMLKLPEFRWMKQLSPDQIIRMREVGVTTLLTDAIRRHHQRLRYASVDQFEEVAQDVMEDLRREVLEFDKYVQLDKKKINRQLTRTSISFSVTIALTIASVALPPAAVITIPAALISVIIGSSSAKDVLTHFIQGRRRIDALRHRPAAVLASYLPSLNSHHE
jgi:septum formation topological specificity factor MinE